jgi:hypothetical protein
MTDPQCMLIVDDEQNTLADLPLRVLRIGVDVFYVQGPEEAHLLARQEASRIRVLLFPPSIEFDQIRGVRDCLRSAASEVPRTLVVVGPTPDEPTRARLRKGGIELALWEPFDESALRQVLANAVAVQDHAELREVPRFPTTLLGRAFSGIHRRDVIVSTLSLRGAFLETPSPFLPETPITLELALPEGQLVTKARVVYSEAGRDSEPPAHPLGMGIAFAELDPAAEERLESFLAEMCDRFGV